MTTKILVIFLIFSTSVTAQRIDYNSRLDLINENITSQFYLPQDGLYKETSAEKNERKHSYLWPLCALMQAHNELEAVRPGSDYLSPVMNAIQQYYNPNPPTPGYQAYVSKEQADTRYYDDNQWIGIAAMDVYHRTGKATYLELSKTIYRFMMTGYDTVTGGGIYWREGDKSSKNTCSNGPGILLALQLYKVTGQKGYLDTALLLYNWTNKHLLAPEGVYFDAIRIPQNSIDKAFYTYNTGTMLQSSVLLYTILKEDKYLAEAKRIASAAEQFFYKEHKLPDNYWFNAVMLRGFVELYHVEKDKHRLQFIVDDAERIWKEERDGKNLLGRHEVKSLIDQAAMIEIYARLQQLITER